MRVREVCFAGRDRLREGPIRRTIAGGRPAVRAALFMATLAASRANPVITAHYKKLRAAGKTRKQAFAACMRKLLVLLNAILRDRKPVAQAAE
jgi:transposase